MTAVFLLSAAVQWNDADPLRWMLIYSGAAAFSLWFALRPLPWRLPAGWATLSILWSLTLSVAFAEDDSEFAWGAFWGSIAMKTESVELGREIGGLLIVVAWMTVIARACYRAR
jgi:hypothetical protein